MTGNIWMCSHLLDEQDLEFGKHDFITYKMGQEYYGMGEKRFANAAWKAGAVYKCGKLVLIRRDIFEAYLRKTRLKEVMKNHGNEEKSGHAADVNEQVQGDEDGGQEICFTEGGLGTLQYGTEYLPEARE